MTSQERSLGASRQDEYRILRDADLRDYFAQLPAVASQLGGLPTDWSINEVEDHRAPVLQNLKVCVSASPGDVKDIASPELPTSAALEPATQEANSSHGTVSSEKTGPAATIAAT